MKPKKLLIPVLASIIFIFGSCKKGKDDPAFSFSSRNARITNVWVLKSLSKSKISKYKVGDNTYTSSNLYAFDGTTMKVTSNNGFGDQTESYPYSYELNIDENGVYTQIIEEDGEKDVYTGYWFWANSDKNKTAITLDAEGTFIIDRLAKDELVLTRSLFSENTDTDGKVTTITEDITMKFSAK